MTMYYLVNQPNGPYLLIKNIFKSTVFSISTKAAPCFRRLVAELLPWRPRFNSRPDYVGFVLDKGAWGQITLRLHDISLPISFRQCSILI